MHILKTNTRGFTLIELLVVISLLGLLSSVILAAVSSAKDRGRVAAGQQMSTHLFHAFGADATGVWNMDESAAGNALDDSGYGRTAVWLSPCATTPPTRVPGINGNGISFNGTNQCVFATMGSNPAASTKWTIATWLKPASVSSPRVIEITPVA